MQPPEVREPRGIQPFARFGRPPKCFGRLSDVVLKEPRLRERALELDLLLAGQPGPLHRSHEERGRVRAAALLERSNGLAVEVRRRHRGDSIPRIHQSATVDLEGLADSAEDGPSAILGSPGGAAGEGEG